MAIDLYCGLGGWTEGLIAEGWDVVGFDNERHVYGDQRYSGQLVMQDVLTLHGSQFRHADLIVGSSPCTDYAYMAMPWSLAKAKAAAIRADLTGEMLRRLNELFDAQFRIQREACEAAGRHIPMVVENVRGAQPWVGRAAWNFGSYYLWGDVPALMPRPHDARKNPGFRFDGSGKSFQTASVEGMKNANGGSWFGVGPRGEKGQSANPARGAAIVEGRKGAGAGAAWFDQNLCVLSSKSSARKAASASIAKIPFALSSHIGRTFHPRSVAA